MKKFLVLSSWFSIVTENNNKSILSLNTVTHNRQKFRKSR